MTRSETDGWQRRRSQFNHDWLKNVYLPGLGAWLNVIDGLVEDPEFRESFCKGRFLQWEERATDVRALLDEFESQMSPRVLFEEPPLSAMGGSVRNWLLPLVDLLWRHRVQVEPLLDQARRRLASCERVYGTLRRHVGEGVTGGDALRSGVAVFASECTALSATISQLPDEILVT